VVGLTSGVHITEPWVDSFYLKSRAGHIGNIPPFENREGRGSLSVVVQTFKNSRAGLASGDKTAMSLTPPSFRGPASYPLRFAKLAMAPNNTSYN